MKALAPFLCIFFIAFTNVLPLDQKDSILDEILKNMLDSLREIAKDLVIPETAFGIGIKEVNITGSIQDGLIKNLNNFVIQKLTTTLLPLRLTNLTLTLDHVSATGYYSLNGTVDLPNFVGPFDIFGNGPFKIEIYGIFFTIAADFKLEDFKPQIAPNGLNGFNFFINKSEIKFENLMGGGEKGDAINKYLSMYLPDLIGDYKFVFFNSIRNTLIDKINDFLAGKNTTLRVDQIY